MNSRLSTRKAHNDISKEKRSFISQDTCGWNNLWAEDTCGWNN